MATQLALAANRHHAQYYDFQPVSGPASTSGCMYTARCSAASSGDVYIHLPWRSLSVSLDSDCGRATCSIFVAAWTKLAACGATIQLHRYTPAWITHSFTRLRCTGQTRGCPLRIPNRRQWYSCGVCLHTSSPPCINIAVAEVAPDARGVPRLYRARTQVMEYVRSASCKCK